MGVVACVKRVGGEVIVLNYRLGTPIFLETDSIMLFLSDCSITVAIKYLKLILQHPHIPTQSNPPPLQSGACS